MKSFNLSIDNQFRHPLRWGNCPLSVGSKIIVYGIVYTNMRNSVGRIRNDWALTFYFHRWSYGFTNIDEL